MTDQMVPSTQPPGDAKPLEAIVAIDPEGRIAQANSGAEDLFGYSWDELAHRPGNLTLRGRRTGTASSMCRHCSAAGICRRTRRS